MENMEFNSSDIQKTKSQDKDIFDVAKAKEIQNMHNDYRKKLIIITSIGSTIIIGLIIALTISLTTTNDTNVDSEEIAEIEELEDENAALTDEIMKMDSDEAQTKIDEFFNEKLSNIPEDDYDERAILLSQKAYDLALISKNDEALALFAEVEAYPVKLDETKFALCEGGLAIAAEIDDEAMYQSYSDKYDELYYKLYPEGM